MTLRIGMAFITFLSSPMQCFTHNNNDKNNTLKYVISFKIRLTSYIMSFLLEPHFTDDENVTL